MNLIKAKQIDNVDLINALQSTFATVINLNLASGTLQSQISALAALGSGVALGVNYPVTSGVYRETYNYAVTYTGVPKVSFTLIKPSGQPLIWAEPYSRSPGSISIDFSNIIPTTGYSIDIITSP